MTAPWYLIPVAFLACLLGAWVSYHDARHSRAAPWVFAGLAAFCGYLWGLAAARIGTADGVYVYSLAWDAAVCLAYTAVPLAAGWCAGDWRVYAGAALVVAGVVLAKAGAA